MESTTIEKIIVTDKLSKASTTQSEATSLRTDKTSTASEADSATDEITSTAQPTDKVTLLPSTDEGSGTTADSTTTVTPTSSKAIDLKDRTEEPSFISTTPIAEASGTDKTTTDEPLFETTMEGHDVTPTTTRSDITTSEVMSHTRMISPTPTMEASDVLSTTHHEDERLVTEMVTFPAKSPEIIHLNATTSGIAAKEIVATSYSPEKSVVTKDPMDITTLLQSASGESTENPEITISSSQGDTTSSIDSLFTTREPAQSTLGILSETTMGGSKPTSISSVPSVLTTNSPIVGIIPSTTIGVTSDFQSTTPLESEKTTSQVVTTSLPVLHTTEADTVASKRPPEQLIASDEPGFIMTSITDSRQDATDEPFFETTMEGSGMMSSPLNEILFSTKSALASTRQVTPSSRVDYSTAPVVEMTDFPSNTPIENETASSDTVTSRPRVPEMIQLNGTTDIGAKETVSTSNTPDELMTTLQQVDEATKYQSTSRKAGLTSSLSVGHTTSTITTKSTTKMPTLRITSEGSGFSSPSTLDVSPEEKVASSPEPEVTQYKTVEIIDSSDEFTSTSPSSGMATVMNDTNTVIGSTDIKSTRTSIRESTIAPSTPSVGDAIMNTDKMYTEDLKGKGTNATEHELSFVSTNMPAVEGGKMTSPQSIDKSRTTTSPRRAPEQLVASDEPGFIMTTITDSRQDATDEPFFETTMEGSGMMSSPLNEILSTKSAPVSIGKVTTLSTVDGSTAALVVMTDFPSKAPFGNETASSETVTSRPRVPEMIQLNMTTDTVAKETNTSVELMTTLVTSKPSSTWFTVLKELESSAARSKNTTTDSQSPTAHTTMETFPSASVKLFTSLESQRTVMVDDSKVTELQEPSTGSPDIESKKLTRVVELISETSIPTATNSVTVSSKQEDKVTTTPSPTSSTTPIILSTLKDVVIDHTVTDPTVLSSRAASTFRKIITHSRTPSSMVSEQTDIPENVTPVNETDSSTTATTVIGIISGGMNYITNLTMTTFGGIFTTAQPPVTASSKAHKSNQTEVPSTVETKSALSRILEAASTSRTLTVTTEDLFATEDGSGKEGTISPGRGQPSTTVFSVIRTQRTDDHHSSQPEETDKQTDRLRIPSTPPPPPPYPPMITTLQPSPVDIITTSSSPPPPPPTTPPPPPTPSSSPMEGLPRATGTTKLPVALVATTEGFPERTIEPDGYSGDKMEGDSIAAIPASVPLNLPAFMARIRECGKCGNDICPVCGTNGFTYQSECILNQTACLRGIMDLEVAYQGECINGFLELVKGDISCQEFECPVTYNPVCGSDNKTYTNSCELQKATLCSEGGTSIEKISDGICKTNS